MRRLALIMSMLLVTVIALVAFVRQDAPRPTIVQTVGVLPRAPFDERFCAWFVGDTPLGAVPTGDVRCTWYRPTSAMRSAERDEIFYQVVSRRVKYVQRSWEPATRARWLQDLDSVRVALAARGGVRACSLAMLQSDTVVKESWRFPKFEVRLFAGGGSSSGLSGKSEPRWAVFLHAERGRHIPC